MLKSDPYGTRTRVAGVKGRSPRPLDEGAAADQSTDQKPVPDQVQYDTLLSHESSRLNSGHSAVKNQPRSRVLTTK